MSDKDKLLNVLDIVIYVIFGAFLIFRGFATNGNIVMKAAFFIMGFFFITVGFLISNQKKLYKEAIHELNDHIDYEKASAIYEKVVRFDYLRIYTKQRYFFDLMVMTEAEEYEKVLWIIEMNEDKFNVNDNLKMIKLYYLIRAHFMLGNRDEVKKNYKELEKMVNEGKKPNLFFMYEVRGIYEAISGNRAKALEEFKKIDLDRLCRKDRKWILKNLVSYSSGNEKKAFQKQYDAFVKELERKE